MTLFEKIKTDRINAKKQKNEVASSILTVLFGELENQSKRNVVINDELVIQSCKKFILNNDETIKLVNDEFTKSRLQAENLILQVYLPVQLTIADLRSIINKLNINNLGQIMKYLKENYTGQYDGKDASIVAKEFSSTE